MKFGNLKYKICWLIVGGLWFNPLLAQPKSEIDSAYQLGISEMMEDPDLSMSFLLMWEVQRWNSIDDGTERLELSDEFKNLRIKLNQALGKTSESGSFTPKEMKAIVKSKAKFEESELEELLALLRLKNRTSRITKIIGEENLVSIKIDEKEVLRKLAMEEVGKVAKYSPDKIITLNGNPLPAKALKQALKDLDVSDFSKKELVDFLGKLRSDSSQAIGKYFFEDLKNDTIRDLKWARLEPGSLKITIVPEEIHFPPNQFLESLWNTDNFSGGSSIVFGNEGNTSVTPNIPRQNSGNIFNLPEFNLQNHSGAIRKPGCSSCGRGTPRFSAGPSHRGPQIGSSSSNQGLLLKDANTPNQSLNNAELGNLGKGAKEFSVPIRGFFNNSTQEFSSCQATDVKKEAIGDSCTYAFATARHCVVNDQNSAEKLTRLEIEPFGIVPNVKIELDPSGHDMALILFKTRGACKSEEEVPLVPLRQRKVGDAEPILVDGRTVLAGRANYNVIGNSLVQLDVRDSVNGGIGIYPGDSGGGVATVGPDGKLFLVGVISSKPTDESLHGIGYFAAQDSMDWALARVTPSNGSRQIKDTTIAQNSTPAHAIR